MKELLLASLGLPNAETSNSHGKRARSPDEETEWKKQRTRNDEDDSGACSSKDLSVPAPTLSAVEERLFAELRECVQDISQLCDSADPSAMSDLEKKQCLRRAKALDVKFEGSHDSLYDEFKKQLRGLKSDLRKRGRSMCEEEAEEDSCCDDSEEDDSEEEDSDESVDEFRGECDE